MRFLTHKSLLLALFFACEFSLLALTFETRLLFQEEGDLTAIVECAIPDKCAGILQEYAMHASQGDNRGLLDEEAVRRHCEKFPDAELKGYNVYTIPEGRRVRIEIFAKDARKFLASNALGIVTLTDLPESDNVSFSVPLPKVRYLNAEQKQQAKDLAELVGGIDIILWLQSPKPLVGTTGKCDAVDRCQWRINLENIIQGNIPNINAVW